MFRFMSALFIFGLLLLGLAACAGSGEVEADPDYLNPNDEFRQRNVELQRENEAMKTQVAMESQLTPVPTAARPAVSDSASSTTQVEEAPTPSVGGTNLTESVSSGQSPSEAHASDVDFTPTPENADHKVEAIVSAAEQDLEDTLASKMEDCLGRVLEQFEVEALSISNDPAINQCLNDVLSREAE